MLSFRRRPLGPPEGCRTTGCRSLCSAHPRAIRTFAGTPESGSRDGSPRATLLPAQAVLPPLAGLSPDRSPIAVTTCNRSTLFTGQTSETLCPSRYRPDRGVYLAQLTTAARVSLLASPNAPSGRIASSESSQTGACHDPILLLNPHPKERFTTMFRTHRRLGSLAAAFALVVGSSIGLTQDANAYVTCGSAGSGH